MQKLITNTILIIAGISLMGLISSNKDKPEVQAQPNPWEFIEIDEPAEIVPLTVEEFEDLQDQLRAEEPSASAPLTKLVWAQDCSSGSSCVMVQIRVPYGDSRPEVESHGSMHSSSNSRVGLFRRIFGRR